MNLKLKNTLIITGTLVLGIFIGILICGRFTKLRLENLKSFYTEKGFKKQFIHYVHPTQEQMKKLAPIFKESNEKNRELIKEFRKKRHDLFLEFKEQVSEILTPEQLEKLDELEQRNMRMIMKRKGHKPGMRGKHPHKSEQ